MLYYERLNLELKNGAILQLESSTLKAREFSKLIGINEGNYLITSVPKSVIDNEDQTHISIGGDDYPALLHNLSNNGCLVIFDENVDKIQQMLKPDKLLYIKFEHPESTEKYEIDCIVENTTFKNNKLEVGFSFRKIDTEQKSKLNRLIKSI